jgi:hypothetical protein
MNALISFIDWYNNEHIPLRMNHPSFHTGARFHAIDSKTPSWFAVYDIADTSVFESESYTRFRTDRSPREVDLIGRLQLLDRRTSQLLDDSGISDKTTSYHFENPTKVIVTYGASAESDEAFGAWAKKTFEALRAVDGWVRTRTYHVFDIVKTGLSVGKGAEEQKAPKYLVIHGEILFCLSVGRDFLMQPSAQ